MWIPFKMQPIQQMNLIPLQLAPSLILPLSTSPPTQGPQFLLGFFTQSGYIRICNGAFEVAMSISFVEGLEMTIVSVPVCWFEE